MGKRVAITGINSYFASTVLPRLEADPQVETIIGIDVSPWKGGFDKVTFYREDIRGEKIGDLLTGVDVLYHLAFIINKTYLTGIILHPQLEGDRSGCSDRLQVPSKGVHYFGVENL